MSPSGASSRSTITGRVVARPFAFARLAVDPGRAHPVGDRRAGEDQVDPHPEVAVEHPGPVVPVAEDALVRPAVADDVAQAERLRAPPAPRARAPSRGSGRRRPPGRRRPRRSGRCSCRRRRPSPRGRRRPRRAARPARRACTRSARSPARARSARRPRAPGCRRRWPTPHAPPDAGTRARPRGPGRRPPARRARGSRRRSRSPRREPRPRSRDRPARRRAGRANASSASFVSCRQTTSGSPFVQPRQQPRQPLLDRVHVPGRDPHPADGTRRAEKGVLGSPCLRKGSK